MKSNIFKDSIDYECRGPSLLSEDLENWLPFEFRNSDFFVELYSQCNGIIFAEEPVIYRDAFYQVDKGDYNMFDIGAFLSIADDLTSIDGTWKYLQQNENSKAIAMNHFPFAIDSSGNLFLVESKTGIIKYLRVDTFEPLIVIAPSLKELCNALLSDI